MGEGNKIQVDGLGLQRIKGDGTHTKLKMSVVLLELWCHPLLNANFLRTSHHPLYKPAREESPNQQVLGELDVW